VRRILAIAASALGLLFLGSMIFVYRLTEQPVSSTPAPNAPAANVVPPTVTPAPVAAASPVAAGALSLHAPAAATRSADLPALGPPTERSLPVAPTAQRASPGAASRIDFSFKLDPRLTSSLHMGERWVSPPTYSRVGEGARNVGVEARAHVFDGSGKALKASPTWRPSEPDMVQVSPDEGNQVEITVWRAGESKLTVNSGGASRTLTVKAAQHGGGYRVEIVQ